MGEYDEIELVAQALHKLYSENDAWGSNRALFLYSYDDKKRIIWWRRAKKQAEAGVPAMQQLLLKVIELRLKG